MLSSKIVLETSWELCSGWKLIFQVPIRPFWRVLESFWESVWRYFGISCRYRFHNRSLYDFKMIFVWFSYPLDKQKWANCMGGPAKIKLSCCSLLNVFGNWFWKDFGDGMEGFLRPDWPLEAYSKAMLMNYVFLKPSELVGNPPPPPKIGGFWSPVGGIREGLTRRDTPTGSADSETYGWV